MAVEGNTLTQADLVEIVERASSLADRLGDAFVPDSSPADEAGIERRLEAWRQAVAKGDADRFRQRLAWDSLTEADVRPVLGRVRLRKGAPLPGWTEVLSHAVRLAVETRASEGEPGPGDRSLKPAEPLPFEELLLPFVWAARRRLAEAVGDNHDLLSEAAHAALERHLLGVLTHYAAQALYLEFSIHRQQRQSPLDRLLGLTGGSERTLYDSFVERLYEGGLAVFFREYAVLARLLSLVTQLWVEATAEFLDRLAADRPAIQRLFGDEADLGPVVAVQPSLSDPHRGRRSVIALTFATGLKLVYKPKDLGMEEAYMALLAWLNDHGAPLPFKRLRVINRGTHGWVEFVEHLSCATLDEARRYYQRAGMLLCLVYVLDGTDCHSENIIAHGEHPVLVDMETLLQHRVRLGDTAEVAHAGQLALDQLDHSVLRTGLLPTWEVGKDTALAYDVSGLGGATEQVTPYTVPAWENVNTDAMTLWRKPSVIPPAANIPRLDDVPLRLDEHVADVVEGFRRLYHCLMDQRANLLAPSSPLHTLAHHQVRFIYRPSRIYAATTTELLEPKYLHDGVDRSIHLERLGRVLVSSATPSSLYSQKSYFWSMFVIERQAMEQLDVPFFTSCASGVDLETLVGETIENCFVEPSFEVARARLKALSNQDLVRQTAFIKGSLYAYLARDLTVTTEVASADKDENWKVAPLTVKELEAQVVTIADKLLREAICAQDGSVTWIGPEYLVQADRFQLQPLGYDLYSGACGIALFLAAAEKMIGDGYRKRALGAVQPLRQELKRGGERLAQQVGIGGGDGLGSIVYSLARMSQFLDDPTLIEDARRAASLITPDRIIADQHLDLLSGTAGASLALLALDPMSLDQVILDRIALCGHHLVRRRALSPTGYRAWATFGGKCMTGFSQGAAGIAYALLRLYEVFRETSFREAAEEGIAYEDSVFSTEDGNWPDLRQANQPVYMTSWCQGAPGIGLGRLGGLPVLDNQSIRQDIVIAVQTTQRMGLGGRDHLCCGNLGRAEFLLVAGQQLEQPELLETALLHASQVVTRANRKGLFSLGPLLSKEVYNPSFFHGMAGIGYQLLRIAHPDILPSVLLWR